MYDEKWREAELIAKVKKDFFNNDEFDTTEYIGNIDFCVVQKPNLFISKKQALFWAEAKRGETDNIKSIIQLILTIGKEKTHEKHLPPEFIGAFNVKQIVFVPFNEIASVFNQNDFNFNVPPSNHESKEFKQLHIMLKKALEKQSLVFDFFDENDEFNILLQRFIKKLRVRHGNAVKIGITHNNFFKEPYHEWLKFVKPTINANFEKPLEKNVFTPNHNEFYLADLFADENSNKTLENANLRLNLQNNHYILRLDELGKENATFYFTDEAKAHKLFWQDYQRPPKEQYWKNILKRRDLLAPKDKREYQGAFFTPRIWTLKAKEYLESVLGKGFEKEYIIWDCAAGTGNLLEFFDENAKANIYASTLDEADVKIMRQRVQNERRFPIFERHIFQFDFLNDDFSKLPQALQEIINDENKRQRLIIFINPPYGEVGNPKSAKGKGKNKDKIAKETKIYKNYSPIISTACSELFAQFFIRIYKEIPNCILASFSTPKYISYQNFIKFRENFKAKFLKGFVCPSNTFDNNSKLGFPIGFFIWDLSKHDKIKKVSLEICDTKFNGIKNYFAFDSKDDYITSWLQKFYDKDGIELGILMADAPDFQNNNHTAFLSKLGKAHLIYKSITSANLIPFCIYFATRQAIAMNWLNNKDNFLSPNNKWEKDKEFQSDCLAFALFHGQNKISSIDRERHKFSKNHFIPFTENEVNAKEAFKSDFMVKFINGEIKTNKLDFNSHFIPTQPLKFSNEAKVVFDAGREIWRYYHTNAIDKNYNANVSLYDIKEYFQGREIKANGEFGDLNKTSEDEFYNDLIVNLREALKNLAEKITPKIYEYGFLRE